MSGARRRMRRPAVRGTAGLPTLAILVALLLAVWVSPVLAAPKSIAADAPSVLLSDTAEPLTEVAGQLATADGSERLDIGKVGDYAIWLRLTLDSSSTRAQPRILTLGLPNTERLAVYEGSADGPLRPILHLDRQSSFFDRPIAHPMLALPVTLPSGRTEIVIGYTAHGNTPLQPMLMTPAAYDQEQLVRHLLNGAVFGLFAAMLIFALVNFVVERKAVHLLYAAVLVLVTLYLAEVEGYAFMFLWPYAGDWNHFAPFVLAGAAQAAHLAFLVIILDVRRLLPRLFVAMQAYVAVGLALLGWFAVGGPIVPLMIFSVVVYVPMLVVLMLRAMRLQIDGAGFLLMGQLSVLVFFNLLFSAGVEGVVIPPGMYFFHYAKIGFLLEAIFYLFALGSRSRLVRLRHENNLRLRLLESEELARAEAERFKALQAARQHQLHIAASGHDLAQPVHSMRMALSAIKDDEQSATSRHIAKALDLTEDLLRDMVEGAKHGPRLYPLALGDLLQEVHERHLDRARRKGLELRIVVPDLTLNASPIVLTRLLDNLVGNAIRYTDRGRVLIGARRRPGGVEIQVADTGPGFATAERDRLLAPFQQGGALREESAGHGLGLYIVERLCRQSGYDLRIASRRGRGSVFGIFIPEGE